MSLYLQIPYKLSFSSNNNQAIVPITTNIPLQGTVPLRETGKTERSEFNSRGQDLQINKEEIIRLNTLV